MFESQKGTTFHFGDWRKRAEIANADRFCKAAHVRFVHVKKYTVNRRLAFSRSLSTKRNA
jgi:hypothetical protein